MSLSNSNFFSDSSQTPVEIILIDALVTSIQNKDLLKMQTILDILDKTSGTKNEKLFELMQKSRHMIKVLGYTGDEYQNDMIFRLSTGSDVFIRPVNGQCPHNYELTTLNNELKFCRKKSHKNETEKMQQDFVEELIQQVQNIQSNKNQKVDEPEKIRKELSETLDFNDFKDEKVSSLYERFMNSSTIAYIKKSFKIFFGHSNNYIFMLLENVSNKGSEASNLSEREQKILNSALYHFGPLKTIFQVIYMVIKIALCFLYKFYNNYKGAIQTAMVLFTYYSTGFSYLVKPALYLIMLYFVYQIFTKYVFDFGEYVDENRFKGLRDTLVRYSSSYGFNYLMYMGYIWSNFGFTLVWTIIQENFWSLNPTEFVKNTVYLNVCGNSLSNAIGQASTTVINAVAEILKIFCQGLSKIFSNKINVCDNFGNFLNEYANPLATAFIRFNTIQMETDAAFKGMLTKRLVYYWTSDNQTVGQKEEYEGYLNYLKENFGYLYEDLTNDFTNSSNVFENLRKMFQAEYGDLMVKNQVLMITENENTPIMPDNNKIPTIGPSILSLGNMVTTKEMGDYSKLPSESRTNVVNELTTIRLISVETGYDLISMSMDDRQHFEESVEQIKSKIPFENMSDNLKRYLFESFDVIQNSLNF